MIVFGKKVILSNIVPQNMALMWMSDEDLTHCVLDGISDKEFSDESEVELSVPGESESDKD